MQGEGCVIRALQSATVLSRGHAGSPCFGAAAVLSADAGFAEDPRGVGRTKPIARTAKTVRGRQLAELLGMPVWMSEFLISRTNDPREVPVR